mmetsp:Transcript_17878/g.26447  ORF Transcript_17878/g.26447 Transcript_17878/m.26447 type:complete len:423 (-) Transcript_17878:249-1517(-)|eukprot:CAMPEP_0194203924 /NCGR_PEP_ID=MMETSP0156-20130528/3564_1 /TAXON_ID=33649 /ORGANISM="Thalassionema nitzschioides, Strain L26-B" /LENGTH=422 /DNA_ID=CAMNT_0038929785 /DNA_START=218 /DNA_END=1486 /DNA_ORIENTATION=+
MIKYVTVYLIVTSLFWDSKHYLPCCKGLTPGEEQNVATTGSGKEDDDAIVPFSYSIHRNATYQIPIRHFSMGNDGIIGMLSRSAGSMSSTLEIEQRFREEGAGLGSAQWDGSFVLSEALQRLDFSKAHIALDEAIRNNRSSFRIPPWSRSQEARRLARSEFRQQHRTCSGKNSSCYFGDVPRVPSHLFLPWRGKYTVELGTGLGLVSLVSCLMGAKSVATDGDQTVLQHARRNFAKKLNQYDDDKTHYKSTSASLLSILDPWMSCRCSDNDNVAGMVTTTQLLWGDSRQTTQLLRDISLHPYDQTKIHGQNDKYQSSSRQKDLDFVLAADVVYGYDKDAGYDRLDTFEALVQSLLDLCSLSTLIVLAYQPLRSTERTFFDKMLEKFEGVTLDQTLLHPDFFLSKMKIYVFRHRGHHNSNHGD